MRHKILRLRPIFGLKNLSEGPEVAAAAQLVFDAVTDRNIYHKLDQYGRSQYLRLHKLRHVFALAVWSHLLIGWVEDNSHQAYDWLPALHTDGDDYWAVPAIQVCLLTPVHLYHCYLRKTSSVHWKGDRWLVGKLVCVALIVCDALHEIYAGRGAAPVSRLLRPYLLLDLHSPVRKLHDQCICALASLKELMLLALVCLFFFVLAGMMMYPSASDDVFFGHNGNIHGGDDGKRGSSQGFAVFTDLWTRVANLVYLTFGAVNYPDIMLPSYVEDGASSLVYFFPAILVFLFLFLNIVLAVVYNGYSDDRDNTVVQHTARRCVALTLAFQSITDNGMDISREQFDAFVQAYRELENQYSLFEPDDLDQADELESQLESMWKELVPDRSIDQGNEGEARGALGPCEFCQLPKLLAARRFSKGPLWALREANCVLHDVKFANVRLNDGSTPTTAGSHALNLVGQEAQVIRVESHIGGPKFLTRKLLKKKQQIDGRWIGGHWQRTTAKVIQMQSAQGAFQSMDTRDGAGGRPVNDPTAQEEVRYDWSGGIPLVWRRESDVHNNNEYVTFAGEIHSVNAEKQTCDIKCNFSPKRNENLSICSRFMNGGLRPSLRDFLIRSDVNAVTICVILVSLGFTFFQYLYRNQHTREQQQTWHIVDYCITLFFVTEMIAKMVAFGFLGYWNSTWHRIDLIITTATIASTASLLWNPSRENVPDHRKWMLFKFLRSFRVLRLLRLLSAFQLRKDAVDKYHLIFTVTGHAFGAIRDFLSYTVVVFYLYSIIGIGMFGGEHGLTRGQSKACVDSRDMPNPILANTSYDAAAYFSIGKCDDDEKNKYHWGDAENMVASYYYGVNFDDLSSTFVTLLHMLIMNNWHVTHEACVAVFEDNAQYCSNYGEDDTLVHKACEWVHSRWVVSAYFYSFEFYVALILVNILMSCFLDIYSFVWEKYNKHFEESCQVSAQRNILAVVDELDSIAALTRQGPDLNDDDDEEETAQRSFVFDKCACCLLMEPDILDVRRTYVPLFKPTYGVCAPLAGFDAVNLCQACRRYWSAIEMLTAQHGVIYGMDEPIVEAMSQTNVHEQRQEMELKVQVMLNLQEVQFRGRTSLLPIAPIRLGA